MPKVPKCHEVIRMLFCNILSLSHHYPSRSASCLSLTVSTSFATIFVRDYPQRSTSAKSNTNTTEISY